MHWDSTFLTSIPRSGFCIVAQVSLFGVGSITFQIQSSLSLVKWTTGEKTERSLSSFFGEPLPVGESVGSDSMRELRIFVEVFEFRSRLLHYTILYTVLAEITQRTCMKGSMSTDGVFQVYKSVCKCIYA